ncbi:Transposon Ty3-I Gag-Pol polyprotein [Porphyridium purpureum]|uniref:RNA-directed DNA polymerase n=1 Tax=Porphyridium purpureum TaxID=35688 RepID=A0A5J4YXY8_PORPP|nr:Transposon Ty3-I Gag-Pol polyprotein [Porphyridium purpureum]|eukprot:POR1494..scf209_3
MFPESMEIDSETLGPRGPKEARLMRFDGKRDLLVVKTWLFQARKKILGRLLESIHPDDLEKRLLAERRAVDLASDYFEGEALHWWVLNCERYPQEVPTTWNDFAALVSARFTPLDSIRRARDKLTHLSQKGPAHAYVAAFQDAALVIPDLSDAEMMDRFVRGLKPEVRLEVYKRGVSTFAEAAQVAVVVDDAIHATRGVRDSSVRTPFFGRAAQEGPVPMELGNVQGQRRVRSELKCWNCGKPGHIARKCPEARKTIQQLEGDSLERYETSRGGNGDRCGGLGKPRSGCPTPCGRNSSANQPVIKELGGMGAAMLLRVRGKVHKSDGEATFLIDSGATDNFMSVDFVQKSDGLKRKASWKRDHVTLADGSVLEIAGEVSNVKFTLSDGYSGAANFAICRIAGQDAILGMEWLKRENPVIDWQSGMLAYGEKKAWSMTQMLVPRKELRRLLKSQEVEECYLGVLKGRKEPCSVERKEADSVRKMLKDFENLFEEPRGLPESRTVEHVIRLKDEKPVRVGRVYRLSPAELKVLRETLDDLLDKGFVQPSQSPFGAPVLFVKKKDGSMRMCVDYRALNDATVKDRYPLPNMDELLDRLGAAHCFSKLDLASGYHQLRVRGEDVPKTAFQTRYGQFEFRVMPFGLCNAPAAFQRAMNELFVDLLDKTVIVYLDDILVFTKDRQSHGEVLKEVLSRLQKAGYRLKRKKCSFFVSEVEYLGNIVGNGCVKMDPRKVEALKDWPVPKTVTELRSFLGMTNWFRRFVKGYSTVVAPLTSLLQNAKSKKQLIELGDEGKSAFKKIVGMLTEAPVLALPDPEKPFEVYTDRSEVAVGGWLAQEGRPVAFTSRKLLDRETRYSSYEGELMAVIHCLREFRPYLYGAKFVLHTDHEALKHLMTQKELNGRQARWLDFLAEFDITIDYVKGKSNVVADALSRKPELHALEYQVRCDEFGTGFQAFVGSYSSDPDFGTLMGDLPTHQGFRTETGLLYLRNRVCVPRKFRERVMQLHHDIPTAGHRGADTTYASLITRFYWPKMKRDVSRFVKTCHECQVTKSENRSFGKLKPLSIPEGPWVDISMDFVTELPRSEGSCDAIMTVVDRFSKMALFIPTRKDLTAKRCADLFVKHVVSRFGYPKSIVSDRDPLFTSTFWQQLSKRVGMKLAMSTANHPQTDGQTERVNRVIREMLKLMATNSGWVRDLPLYEFAYNSAPSSATGFAPFKVVYGRDPWFPPSEGWRPARDGQTKDMAEHWFRLCKVHEEVRDNLIEAQGRMQKFFDRRKDAREFQVGDQVLITAPQLRPNKSDLAAPKFLGPVPVIEKVSSHAYRVILPEGVACHDVFPIQHLKPYYGREDYMAGENDEEVPDDLPASDSEPDLLKIIEESDSE